MSRTFLLLVKILYCAGTFALLVYNPWDLLGPFPAGNYTGLMYWLLLMYYHSGHHIKRVF